MAEDHQRAAAARPDRGPRGPVGAKNSPGTGPAGVAATNGRASGHVGGGNDHRRVRRDRRAGHRRRAATSKTAWASVGVDPSSSRRRLPRTATGRSRGHRHAGDGSRRAGRRPRSTRGRHRPPAGPGAPAGPGRARCMRQTSEPSVSSAMVDWPSDQSGAWNSRPRRPGLGGRLRRCPARPAPPGRAATTRSGRRRRAGSRRRHQRGWPTEHPPPPATRAGAHAPDAVSDSSRRGHPQLGPVPRHGRVVPGTQASRRPSGDEPGSGHEVAARRPGHRAPRDPSVATATRAVVVPSAARRSSTDSSHRPDGGRAGRRRSGGPARRMAGRGQRHGRAEGAGSAPIRYQRWSAWST